ncbi:MAG: hypothetical protein HRU15_18605, partial [Planctomycetes bacterium]|nr:hypothetical protein [Planctomycetota bacterium]
LIQRNGPKGSFLSSKTLCNWQVEQPTVGDESRPKVSVIQSMLEEKDAQSAYYILATYLGANMDLPTLTKILGALSVHVLLYHFDNKAYIISALAGILSLHHMCEYADPRLLVTLLSQLSHQIWWCRNDGDIERLKEGSSESMSLHEAVSKGDMTAARRAARIEAVDNENFWVTIDDILNLCIDNKRPVWTRGLTAVRVLHQRSPDNCSISPDDAAAIGATFAAIRHLSKHGTARFQRAQ